MISVVIATQDEAEALARRLSELVPAAVDGLVREVIVADGGSTDETAEVAEDSGARLVRGGIAEAAALARSDWVLTLALAPMLPLGWERKVADRIAAGQGATLVAGAWPWSPKLGVLRRKGAAGPARRLPL